MSILDNPFEEIWHIPNLRVAFPNQKNWLGLDSSRGKNYEDAKNEHVRTVKSQLGTILPKSPARAVLDEIRHKPKFNVRIFPFEADPDYLEDKRKGGTAATLASDDDGATRRKTEKDITPPKGPGRPEKATETTFSPGKGSDVYIFYSESAETGAESADEGLLHELVHACRDVNGVRARFPMTGGYPNTEEFIAVVIVDIYRSRKGNRPLWDYRGARIDPKTFLDSNLSPSPRWVFGLLRAQQPSLYQSLARLTDVPFNPISQLDTEVKSPIRRPYTGRSH